MTPISCSCGRTHPDASALPLVGYQALFDGTVAELRNCQCGSTRAGKIHEDASLCHGCRGLVRGTSDDPKIVVQHCDGSVYCRDCAPTLVVDDPAIENGRAMRRLLATAGHIRRRRT